METPKIAIQANMWGLEELTERFPQIFDEIIESGYAGAESRTGLLDAEEKVIRYLSSHPSFSLIALHTNLKSFDKVNPKQDLEPLLEKMNRAGCKYLVASMGKATETKWFELAAEVAERCKNADVQFCYHNHAGEFANGDEFFTKLTGVYKVPLAVDLAWVHRAGRNVPEFIDRYAEYIRYVHLKDTLGEQWKELGQGEVAMKPILERVARLKLPWWTVEQDSSDKEPSYLLTFILITSIFTGCSKASEAKITENAKNANWDSLMNQPITLKVTYNNLPMSDDDFELMIAERSKKIVDIEVKILS